MASSFLDSEPIKKPAWSAYKIQACRRAELLAQMDWEPAQFNKFCTNRDSSSQTHVRQTADAMRLDLQMGPDKQHAGKWASLRQNCIANFPALGTDFEDAWPVEVYFSKYTYTRNLSGRYAKPGEQTATQEDLSGSRGSQKRKADKENDTPAVSKNNTFNRHAQTQPLEDKTRHNTQLTDLTSSCSSGRAPDTTQRGRDTPNPIVIPFASAAERAAWASCVLCGFQPPIPRPQKAAFTQFFKEQEDLRSALEAAGIVADHHFRALLRLSAHQRDRFMQSLAPSKMTQFEMVVLCDMLQDHVNGLKVKQKLALGTDTRARKIPLMEIAKPPRSMLTYFDTLRCDYTRIRERMEISDEEEYFDLVRKVEEMAPLFLENKKYEEQDVAQVKALMKSICEERPSFRRYDELWPLPVHIKRFLAARMAGLSGTLYGSEGFQSDYAMEELGPAFLFLGVRSDKRFVDITVSHRLKTQLLVDENLAHLQLTDFQIMIMRHIMAEA
ncbi:hypothetical protein DFH09DRAFT_1085712 [Mycena vulgaris]|nr:hypothetical protein DFH09DRAFT_1085712 [Mycena vulgaris]